MQSYGKVPALKANDAAWSLPQGQGKGGYQVLVF